MLQYFWQNTVVVQLVTGEPEFTPRFPVEFYDKYACILQYTL